MPFTVMLESLYTCLNTQAKTVLHNGPSYQLQSSAEKNKRFDESASRKKVYVGQYHMQTNTCLYNYFEIRLNILTKDMVFAAFYEIKKSYETFAFYCILYGLLIKNYIYFIIYPQNHFKKRLF